MSIAVATDNERWRRKGLSEPGDQAWSSTAEGDVEGSTDVALAAGGGLSASPYRAGVLIAA